MLILGCKAGETIGLDVPPSEHPRSIAVKIVSVGGEGAGRMRLGIQADKDVLVSRKELVVLRPPDGA